MLDISNLKIKMMESRVTKLLGLLVMIVFAFACGDDPDAEPDYPQITVGNLTKVEGDVDNDFDFKISLSKTWEEEVTVNYETVDETATGGEDYIAKSGSAVIAAGSLSTTVSITIRGDEEIEADETFAVVISGAVNATIINEKGIGTIRNEDDGLSIPNGYSTPTSYAGMNLVWADEFDQGVINSADWTHEIGAGGWGNQELQTYTSSPVNSYIHEEEYLVIEAQKTSGGFTSARMITKDKQEFKYGRIDIRAVLPEGQGIWPALWMLGENISSDGWPACGEIDIMELVGHIPGRVYGTVHYGPNNAGHQHKGTSKSLGAGEKFSDEFHVFSIIWEEDAIRFLMDDVEFFDIFPSDLGSNAYPFNNEFFFIFNIAVGGEWPGDPNESTIFPQRMIVDYVRVFQ